MIDERACPHEQSEPVYAVLHRHPVTAGDVVTYANDGKPVARICTACHAQLPVAWGCTACSWVEARRLCDPVPQLLLARACQEHA